MSSALVRWKIHLLYQHTIGDDLIVRGGRHDELAGRFVVRMIDHRQPLTRVVRPVLAERGAFAVDVLADPQSRRRHAAVGDRDYDIRPGFRIAERYTEPVRAMLVLRHVPRNGDGAHRHPFSVAGRREIEIRLRDAFSHNPECNRRLTGNLVGRICQAQSEDVMQCVETGLTGVGVSRGARRAEEAQHRDECVSQHELRLSIKATA